MVEEAPTYLRRPPIERHVHIAIQRVSEGSASDAQQKAAFDWIVQELAAIGHLSYRPDARGATEFMEGRRFVGVVLVGLLAEPAVENPRPEEMEQSRYGRGQHRIRREA